MKRGEKETKKMTIVNCLATVVNEVRNSCLNEFFWERCKKEMTYLRKRLKMTNMQIIILSILVEKGEPMSWGSLGEYMDCNRLEIMTYTEEIEEMVTRRWFVRSVEHSPFSCGREAFELAHGVVTALRHNKVFVPEKLHDLTLQQLVDKLEAKVNDFFDEDCDFKDMEEYVRQMCELNKELPLCKQALRFKNFEYGVMMFMLIVANYAAHGDTPQHGVSINCLTRVIPSIRHHSRHISTELQNGTHPLIRYGHYIEFKCEDGIANTGRIVLSRKAITTLLDGYMPSMSNYRDGSTNSSLIGHPSIRQKDMFYNNEDKASIDTIARMLAPEQFKQVQERLTEQGQRKGVSILFYGAPGTGKTETVKQIARLTGRDIMMVDIASMRDKFVGETEKNIKAVFTSYRNECRNSEVAPILLFNEADSIFGKRFKNTERSVDKMENAMQNIILQEMEDLEGVLIATTNLTSNLDGAFERRFLFKVNFHTPNEEVKTKLWLSMMGNLINEKEAQDLAKQFDFSGGQIENISRKCSVHYVVYGNKPSFNEIEGFCNEEHIDDKGYCSKVGFRA